MGGVVITASARQDQGREKADQEVASRSRELDANEETPNNKYDQGCFGERKGVGCEAQDNVDRLGIVVRAIAEGIGIVRKRRTGGAAGILLGDGGQCVIRDRLIAGARKAGKPLRWSFK